MYPHTPAVMTRERRRRMVRMMTGSISLERVRGVCRAARGLSTVTE